MREKVNDFVDLYPAFHDFLQVDQIARLVYFHAVEEGRESINKEELERLFRLADSPVPTHLARLLMYMSGKGAKLIRNQGEYSLRREVRRELEDELNKLRGVVSLPKRDGNSPFEFEGKKFSDKKIAALLEECRRCWAQQCWNACGLLIRIIVERTLDTVDPTVKAKSGLKDKLNRCREIKTLSKSVRDGLDHLHGAKLFGDVAAHHSTVLLDEGDIDIVLPNFRVLLKEVTTI